MKMALTGYSLDPGRTVITQPAIDLVEWSLAIDPS